MLATKRAQSCTSSYYYLMHGRGRVYSLRIVVFAVEKLIIIIIVKSDVNKDARSSQGNSWLSASYFFKSSKLVSDRKSR